MPRLQKRSCRSTAKAYPVAEAVMEAAEVVVEKAHLAATALMIVTPSAASAREAFCQAARAAMEVQVARQVKVELVETVQQSCLQDQMLCSQRCSRWWNYPLDRAVKVETEARAAMVEAVRLSMAAAVVIAAERTLQCLPAKRESTVC